MMSMMLVQVKVGPRLLSLIKENPQVLHEIVFADEDFSRYAFHHREDMNEVDYLHMLAPYFQFLAMENGEDPDDYECSHAVQKNPMYRSMTGEQILGYEFCYGPASYHQLEKAKQITEEWAEHFRAEDLADIERPDVSVFLFYQQAVSEGKTVICGIN